MSHVDDGTLHAYLDGELSALEAVRVEAHANECAACRARLTDERGLIARASELLEAAMPPERPAPPLPARARPRRWRGQWPLPAAASVVLAVAIGWGIGTRPRFQPGGSPAPHANDAPKAEPPAPGPAADEARASAPVEPAPLQDAAAPAAPVENVPAQNAPTQTAPVQTAPAEPAPALPTAARDVSIDASSTLKSEERRAGGVPAAPSGGASLQESQRALAPADAGAPLAGAAALAAPAQPATPTRAFARAPAPSGLTIAAGGDLLGAELLGVPGLPVRSVQVAHQPGYTAVVLVEQVLDSAQTIQVVHRRLASGAAAEQRARQDGLAAASDSLRAGPGDLEIAVTGALPADSLAALRRALRPLPR